MLLVDNYIYIIFGTNARIYTSSVYRINIETLKSECLFDSIQMIENASHIKRIQLDNEYPDDFLAGRYRQEVVMYNKKVYVFGGGKNNGDAFNLKKVIINSI